MLNDWTARDLAARVGDPLTLEYYTWEEPGRLVTHTAEFQIAAVVPIAGAAADRDLAPIYPGITEAKTLGDWDPPFPIDLHRIRRIDEDYWERYRTTPKAFIPLEVGRRLWRSRFGDRTSVRVATAGEGSPAGTRDRYLAHLRAAFLRRRKIHARPARFREPDGNRLLRRARTVHAFAAAGRS